MRRPGPVTRAGISLALWPLIIIFSPVILLAGEPVNRYVMRRVRRSAPAAQIAVVRHGGRLARAAAVRLWVPIILSWSLTWSLVPSKLADSVRGHLKIGHCQ